MFSLLSFVNLFYLVQTNFINITTLLSDIPGRHEDNEAWSKNKSNDDMDMFKGIMEGNRSADVLKGISYIRGNG